MEKNKTGKYLKYAIGEIVLVVVGIIIALQINNWNENRKVMDTELQLYSSMLNDLISEYSTIEYQLNSSKNYDKLHKHVYNEIHGKTPYNPDESFNFLLWYHRYNMFFNEKYTDFLATISNDKIHRRLKAFLRQERITFNTVNEFNEHQLQQVRPYLSKHGINNTETMFKENVNDFSTLINRLSLINYSKLKEQYGSQELDQLLFTIRFKNLWMAQNFNWLQSSNRKFQLVLSHEMNLTTLKGSFELIEPRTIDEMNFVNFTNEEILEKIFHANENKGKYSFTQSEMNRFGYVLMKEEKLQDALRVFKKNTELFSNSWNTYDSYGECLLISGDVENGVKAYKKSLELNPDNSIAKEVIKDIKNKDTIQ